MDKNLLSKGGSSDPMVTLALSCSTIKRKTHVKTKTLEPVWNEQFVWAASPPSSGPAPTLQLDVADYDQLSKADPMGSVTVDLGPFAAAKGKATKKWFALDGGDGAILLVIQWRHSPANDWRPFSAKDKFPGKPPNELRIGLSQGRELAVMDKNLLSKGGSSDPFVNFALEGTAVKFASGVIKKSLDPVWREIFLQPLPLIPGEPVPKLTVACLDHDDLSKSDPMGRFAVEIEPLKDHKISKQWYALEGGSGEIELIVQWYHNPDLAYDPFEEVEEKWKGKAPNELCVAVSQGRNLAIKDHNLLSKGGTSDPRATLTVTGGSSVEKDETFVHKTKSLKKTLNPRWREVWKAPLSAGGDGDGPPKLHCLVDDVDEITSADFMGSIAPLDLAPLADMKIRRKWFDLAPTDSLDPKKTSKDVHGDVELVILWRYNPDLDWDPFDRDAPTPTESPNELRVAAFRGRRLAVKDKNVFSKGGASDPRLKFEVHHGGANQLKPFQTKACKATLNPVWKEQFVKPLRVEDVGDGATLEVACEDSDALSKADPMGSFKIDLTPLAKDQKVDQRWRKLEGDGAEGSVELLVQWWHNPSRHAKELDADARRKQKAEDDARRKRLEEEEARRKAEEAAKRKKALEDAERRRREKEEAERRRKAEEAEAARLAAEERERKRLEDERRKREEDERRRKAREEAERKRKAAEDAARRTQDLDDEENRRRLQQLKDRDADDAKRRRDAARRRKAQLDDIARRRAEDDARRREAARKARADADAARAAAEERRRAEERARLQAEAEIRARDAALARKRRLEAAANARRAEDERLAADAEYRAELEARRAAALQRATKARLAREGDEDRRRERALKRALADGSRNWQPDRESRFSSKPDGFVFPDDPPPAPRKD